MALTDRDIQLFARDAVPPRDRKQAVAYYIKAQDDVRASGYRVTERVKAGIFAELHRIAAAAASECEFA